MAPPRALRDPLATRRDAFARYFEETIAKRSGARGLLLAAMRYSALSPGKRLRPLLVLTACEAVGGKWLRVLPAAAAVECVHAFSLVHDDLPAMDDDDFRRGRPTSHRKFGEALAILTGDALLALAFEELSRLGTLGAPHRRVIEAVRLLARASGAAQLVGGQALDVAAEGRPVKREQVAKIHLRKTGALIAASMAIGGNLGGASPRQVEALATAGLELGLAYQIRDDLLNAGSSLKTLGKRTGTDAERAKATYPRAVGVAAAESDAQHCLVSAFARVHGLGKHAANLERLIAAIAARER